MAGRGYYHLTMPRKPAAKPKQDDPKQSKRFVETAKKIEADENPEAFERAFDKIARRRSVKR